MISTLLEAVRIKIEDWQDRRRLFQSVMDTLDVVKDFNTKLIRSNCRDEKGQCLYQLGLCDSSDLTKAWIEVYFSDTKIYVRSREHRVISPFSKAQNVVLVRRMMELCGDTMPHTERKIRGETERIMRLHMDE